MVFKDIAAGKVIADFSSRPAGNMSLSYGDTEDSLANRKKFLADLGIDNQDLVCAKQVHARQVKYVKEADRGRGASSYESSIPDTDAFITDAKDVPLAIFTADCLSVFLYDAVTPAVGLVHAGWRGTKENITGAALNLMKKQFNTDPEQVYAAFGPAMRNCCYEVEEEFRDFLPQGLSKREGRYFLDLVWINREQLLESGIKEGNIRDTGICTCCRNRDFFSFRQEKESCGRMISVIMLDG